MIQEFRVNNFRSFNEEQILSFEATKETLGEDSQVITMPDGTRLLRFAVVYGANASGKSNLIEAIDFVLDFIKGTEEVTKDMEMNVAPFKFSNSISKNSSFTLIFYVKGKKYRYSLSLNEMFVVSEKLEVYNSQKPTKLFERFVDGKFDNIDFNKSLKVGTGLTMDFGRYTLPNTSMFNAMHHISRSGITDLDDVFEYFNVKCDRTIDSLQNNEEKKEFVINLAKEADFNIENIKIEKKKIPDSVIKHLLEDENAPLSYKNKIKEEPYQTKILFEHSVQDESGGIIHAHFEESEESVGTLSTVGFGVLLHDVLKKNIFLTDDEFENSFHPEVMKKLIFTFLNAENSTSQLLISTHYDPLMDEIDKGNLRADSFWFTEKNDKGSTELYSLVEFNGINSLKSIREAYRSGQMGALPHIID